MSGNNYYKDAHNWPSDPEGTFRYQGKDGDYYLASFSEVTDMEQFSLNFISLLPNAVLNLPDFNTVTFNSSKGCYVSYDQTTEFYFNQDGMLFKYSYSRDYMMGINNLRDTIEITINYGKSKITLPDIKSEEFYDD